MQEVQEIDLLKLLKELWKRAWIILAAVFVGGIMFFLYTYFFVTPQRGLFLLAYLLS